MLQVVRRAGQLWNAAAARNCTDTTTTTRGATTTTQATTEGISPHKKRTPRAQLHSGY